MKTTLHPSIPITRFALLLVASALGLGEARAQLLTARHTDIPGSGIIVSSTTGPLTVSATDSNGFGSYSDSATANYGLLSAMGTTQNGESGFPSIGASGRSTFTDQLTISAPGLAGQNGRLSYSTLLTGNLSTAIYSGGSARTVASVGLFINGVLSTQILDRQLQFFEIPPISDSVSINQTITGTVDFIFGQAFALTCDLEAGVSDIRQGPPSVLGGTANATFDWGTITGVTVGPGNTPVTDAFHISASGTNYGLAYAVPEPSTAMLLGGASLGLLLRRRRVAP